MARKPSGSLPLPWLRFRGFNLQVFLLIFLPISAILLLITFGSLTVHQRAMRSLVGERDESTARIAAALISERLFLYSDLVMGLSANAARDEKLDDVVNSFEHLVSRFDAGVALFSPGGELLASSSGAKDWDPLADGLTLLIDEARQSAGKKPVFSPILDGLPDVESRVYVAAASDPNGPIAIGAFSPSQLVTDSLNGVFTAGPTPIIFIVSPHQQLIYHNNRITSSENPVNHPGVAEALEGGQGTTYVEVDGSEHVVTFSTIEPTSWALVIEEPWETVSNPLLNTSLMTPLVLVPVLIFSLVALWFGARQIIQPLQDLEARSAQLAWGKFDPILESVGGIEEIAHLQNTLIYLAGKIKASQAGLHNYIEAITSGQEDERLRLSRELHDDTIQDLIVLKQRVHLTRMKLSGQPELLTALEEIQKLTEQTIHDLRRLIRGLRPVYLEDLGLVASLEMLAQEITESTGTPVHFRHSGVENRFPPKTEMALYRIAQEGINNSIRHSKASRIDICINYTMEDVTLSIEDNGLGFEIPDSPAEFAQTGHFGLLGIQERVELIGGRFEIHSKPGEGTCLEIFA